MPESLRATIGGFGSAVPDKIVTNFDLEKFLDTSDEWISKRTGIKERRIVADGETTATLATEAARNALADAGMEASGLDMIICATISGEMPFPATACFMQHALGITDIPVFDVSAACSGFLYAMAIGSKFIETGQYERILVVGVDVLSRFADWSDRGSCVLFGDAAGAVVLGLSGDAGKGVIYNVLHANGSGWDYIHVPAGGTRSPATVETVNNGDHFIKMRGRDVYKFAVEKMQWLLGDCMEKCNLTVDDVDLVVPHQVNLRIMKSAAAKVGMPMEKIYINIDRYGNTAGASIPLALDEAYRSGRIGPGSTVMMIAFGAGLTWAGSVVKL
ncbi:MAG: ketoacyl-ACP synthase III [Planctomycetes bacterium]|nr:ketoacyl-ACP synthase III [Planctomycetota bacterium]